MTATPGPPAAESDGGPDHAGYPIVAPPLPGRVTFEQRWEDLTFIHWPVRPESVEGLCPPGTRPDVFADGLTYVALVPFMLSSTRVGTALPLPYVGSFAETNVRLYTVDEAGRHGILFRSAETARLAAVPAIRIGLGVPYTWSRMRVTRDGDQVTYDSVRRWPRRGLRSRVTVTIGDAIQPTPLEVWLTARWGAHTRRSGRTWWVPIEHDPWPLRAAEIVELSDELVDAGAVRPAGDRLRALFSPGLRTRFGRARAVG
ncbi:YqjF family protein [Mycobacterium heidelbergense]|uniref:YqjF family protein n=1 Tax=Mycobacterium heidelbergense TaxID=53376 RepID=UPI003CEAFBB8